MELHYPPTVKSDSYLTNAGSYTFTDPKYEITNAQYERCVRAGACDEPGSLSHQEDPDYVEHPVVSVTWSDADSFCTWAGGRLPTEAEWEYAARGLEGHIYPWGDDAPTCELTNLNDCWGGTMPVGSFPDSASWCGAEDMAGNVWEWVADWYGDYSSEAQTNPTGPETGSCKVQRGGGWIEYSRHQLRAANRDPDTPDDRDPSSGFRCVIPPGE